ncbi:hypothetical protein N7495_004262 [Penicillium taxi]|uniref:uncharacterized protein n=1 Tax=Penicillium taxi TaxID=168475 RepID=UPI002545AEB7|nr:uncharacterized protein N7495_004262 [Penicillium taxi]KAJ5899518.1 hypothetical protein N7495_004262 [Penicillium taxi]
MVYDGKPSKGCGTCRSRKIRCDQARPGCRECTRTNRECPGYRDEMGLIFCDETEAVARKARSVYSSVAASTSSSSLRRPIPPQSTNSSFIGQNSECSIISGSFTGLGDPEFEYGSDTDLQFSMRRARLSPLGTHPNTGVSKHEAICFFLQSHTFSGNFLIKDTLEHFLMASSGSLGQRAIQSSIVAVASAMLSRVQGAGALYQVACKEYGFALELVNLALADPNEAKTDQTLGAVVLLSLYEIVVSRSPQGIEGWASHICGAAALLQYRGHAQWQSIVGIRLFLHLRYQVVTSCLQRDSLVPISLLECTILDTFPGIKNDFGNRLIVIIGNLANLRAKIRLQVLTNHEKILSAACAIEAELLSWLAALPPDFTYSTHTLMPLDASFKYHCHGIQPYKNFYHIYPDIWSPSVWNHYRCARILVSELIISQVHTISKISPASLSEDFRLYCGSLRSTIRHLAVDICRSSPFLLGACNLEVPPETPILPPESYLGGLMLLWPLFVAGMVEGPTHPHRMWVVQCLRMIGNRWGLAQALAEMDILIVDPGMFYSAEIYGEAADTAVESSVLPFSVYHVPYESLSALKEFRELQATSA